jgi:Ricin-type beta-trefoil lectin domain/Ricin-type beta-trefoil lectin domain-like
MIRAIGLGLCVCIGFSSSSHCYAAEIVGVGGKCLDVSGGTNANGTVVQMWDCQPGNQSQQWSFDNGQIVWMDNNKCLDVVGGGLVNGTRVQVWDCQPGNRNQQWDLENILPGQIVWTGGKCLDVSGGGTVNGTTVQLWDCVVGDPNQKWTIR